MLKSSDIAGALTGKNLLEHVQKAKDKRTPLAEGFIYEQTIMMIAADPGLGKSTVSTQVALELAAGLPVFGYFKVLRPMKVFYIQTERNIIEFLERLEVIGHTLPINYENLCVTDEFQKLNFIKPEHVDLFVECVKRDCPQGVDIIFVDPLYSMVSGGLKDDVPASALTKAMSYIQKETKATLWYNHHTVKTQYTNKGDAIERFDPFYGSQWLKAHVTGSYYMIKSDGGVKLIEKKDNYNLLPPEITLEYDPETELCCIAGENLTALQKVERYLQMREIDQKSFTFADLEASTQLCNKTLRTILLHRSILDQLSVTTTSRNKKIYKISSRKTSCVV